MAFPVPILDTLDFDRGDAEGFDALFELGRSLIPRFAPDWTDHNLHDPGITLLDLIAWLVDMQIYQVGFISDRHIAAFAALLGIRPLTAVPARGTVWPHETDATDPLRKGVNIKRASQVTCAEQPAVPFQTSSNIHISPARFATQQPQVKSSTNLWTNSPAARPLISRNSEPGLIELHFDRPLVQVQPGLRAYPISLGVELTEYSGSLNATAESHERLVVDYRLSSRPWQRIRLVRDNTHALNRTGTVQLIIPPSTVSEPSQLRLHIRDRVNPLPPKIKHIALNVVDIVQQQTRPTSLLGGSNGSPDQEFQLPLEGRTSDAVRIEVQEGARFRRWKKIDDLRKASPKDEVFKVHFNENKIVFGNGVNGRIPPRFAQIRHRNYALTQGRSGNLIPGLNWRIQGAPTSPGRTTYGLNRYALTNGQDAWDLIRLKTEARQAAVDRKALLTNDDLKSAAEQLIALGVHRAELADGFHPALPKNKIPGARTLIVVPQRATAADPLTPVSSEFVSAINRSLRPRRVLGERLSIQFPELVPITVHAQLLIDDGFNADTVKKEASTRLNAWLSDIPTEFSTIAPRPIGLDITGSEIEAILSNVPGVVAVPSCTLARDGAQPSDQPVSLAPNELGIGTNHELIIRRITGEAP